MRIVFLYSNHHLHQTTAQPGIAYKLVLAARKAGHEVLIISNVAAGFVPEEVGIEFHLLSGLGDLKTYLMQVKGIIGTINNFEADLIHIHGDMFYLFISWLDFFIQKPLSVYVCETLMMHSKVSRSLFINALKQAKRVFVSCNYIARQLGEFGIETERIKTVRLGLADKYLEVKRFDSEFFDVLYFGDSILARGFDIVVGVAQKLKARRFLCLLRYKSDDCPEVMDLASKCRNLEIRYFPYKEPFPKIISSAKIVLLPFREGMGVRPPLTIVESMAVGANVITTRIGGTDEIVSSGRNGFLVNNWEVKSFYELISRLLKDSEKMKRVGFLARRDIRRMFTDEEYQQILQEFATVKYES